MRNLLKHTFEKERTVFVAHFRHFKSDKNKNNLLYRVLYINPKEERYSGEASTGAEGLRSPQLQTIKYFEN
jgi:hypothetical protein